MKEQYMFMKEYLGKKREKILSKKEVNMMYALVAQTQSKDPSSQVGACFVNSDNEVLSLGYNHQPSTWNEDEFPWNGNVSEIGEENTKYPYIIHAEMDGILNYNGNKKDFLNSTLYVTLFPCVNCAKHAVEIGVKKIVYLNEREETKDKIEAKRLLQACNVEIVSFKEEVEDFKGLEIDVTKEEKKNIKILEKTIPSN